MSIRPGGLKTKDPESVRIAAFDWDEFLDAGAAIVSPEIIVTGADAALITDLVTPVNNARQVNYRIAGGTVGHKYTVTCRIQTDESPSQSDDRSIFVLVQNL